MPPQEKRGALPDKGRQYLLLLYARVVYFHHCTIMRHAARQTGSVCPSFAQNNLSAQNSVIELQSLFLNCLRKVS
ncbi:hypothetical protein [Klebsiella variicola]|uniref:hypothetical protein n=1 Tax=Klebsiella variicola TaxID=244366 RepID=UPI0019D3765D|nr:hypothetical protein [Klebsiella variicola]MBN7738573.1 hypothetical protein [Klebsiella variicola]MDP0880200.1 hypothetical protein [Klebsiella variicola]HBV7913239.1 hypothetical protein [Klebsiella variicola]